MKKIGTWTLAIGLLGLIATFNMDTSVSSGGGDRVHNIGLMNMQQNLLFVFIAAAIAGVVILVSNNQKTKSQTASVDPRAIDKNQTRRACPFCAEHILAKAVVCRFCGRGVVPTETTPVEDTHANFSTRSKEPTAFEILSNYLSAIEDFMRRAYSSQKGIIVATNLLKKLLIHIKKHINKIAVLLLIFGIVDIIERAFFMPIPDRVDNLLFSFSDSLFMVLAGLIIYFRTALIRPGMNNIVDFTTTQSEPKADKNFLPFFGIYLDLVVLQLVIILVIFPLHRNEHLSIAYILSVGASLIGYLLTKSENKLYGVITLIIGFSYIAYRHLFFHEGIYWHEKVLDSFTSSYFPFPFLLPASWIIWIFMISVAIPHVQLLKAGSMRYGNLRGDLTLTVLRHKILLPFCSALVSFILLLAIYTAPAYGVWWIARIFGSTL